MKKDEITKQSYSHPENLEDYLKMFKKAWDSNSFFDLDDFIVYEEINPKGYQKLVNKVFPLEEQDYTIIDFSYLKLFIIGETIPMGQIEKYIVITLLYNLEGITENEDYSSIASKFETTPEEIRKLEHSMLNSLLISKDLYSIPKPSYNGFYHHDRKLSVLYQHESIGLRKIIYLEMLSKYSFVDFSIKEFISWDKEQINEYFGKINGRIDKSIVFAYLPYFSQEELEDAHKILSSYN